MKTDPKMETNEVNGDDGGGKMEQHKGKKKQQQKQGSPHVDDDDDGLSGARGGDADIDVDTYSITLRKQTEETINMLHKVYRANETLKNAQNKLRSE